MSQGVGAKLPVLRFTVAIQTQLRFANEVSALLHYFPPHAFAFFPCTMWVGCAVWGVSELRSQRFYLKMLDDLRIF